MPGEKSYMYKQESEQIRIDAHTFWGVEVVISGCNMRSSWSQEKGRCQLSNSPGVWEHRMGGGQGQASACIGPETRWVPGSGKFCLWVEAESLTPHPIEANVVSLSSLLPVGGRSTGKSL